MSDSAILAAPQATPCTVLSAADPRACTARRSGRGAASLDAERARLTRLVRRGCFVQLPLPALFAFHLAPDAAPDWDDALRLDTPHGALEIADGARLIQGLTGIHPALLPAPGSTYRAWFDAALGGRLAGTPLAGAALAPDAVGTGMDDAICLRLQLRSASHALSTHARAGVATWLALLQQTDWQHERLPLPLCAGMRTESRVLLARHTLPATALRTLAPGDVIVPDNPVFGPDGEGRIHVAGHKVRVRYRGPCSLEIIEVEGKLNPEELEIEAQESTADAWPGELPVPDGDAGGPLSDEALDEALPPQQMDSESVADNAAYETDAEAEQPDADDVAQQALAEPEAGDDVPPEDAGEPQPEAEDFAAEAAAPEAGEDDEAAGPEADDAEAGEPEADEPEVGVPETSDAQAAPEQDEEPVVAEALDPDAERAEALLAAEERGGEEPAAFAARHARSGLDDIPVALSFELGRVSLPLDEVRTLGPGVVLLLDGGSPASLAIVAGGRTLGRGEVVDVEGRFGVRLTEWGTRC